MVNWIDFVVQIYLMWSILLLPLHIIRGGLKEVFKKYYFNSTFGYKTIGDLQLISNNKFISKTKKLNKTVEDNFFYYKKDDPDLHCMRIVI